jgi:hypothetical protein
MQIYADYIAAAGKAGTDVLITLAQAQFAAWAELNRAAIDMLGALTQGALTAPGIISGVPGSVTIAERTTGNGHAKATKRAVPIAGKKLSAANAAKSRKAA